MSDYSNMQEKSDKTVSSNHTCQVSRIWRETHAFSMSLTLSLRTVEISRIFLLNEKQYF